MIPAETRHEIKIDFFRLPFRRKYDLSITKDEELTLTGSFFTFTILFVDLRKRIETMVAADRKRIMNVSTNDAVQVTKMLIEKDQQLQDYKKFCGGILESSRCCVLTSLFRLWKE